MSQKHDHPNINIMINIQNQINTDLLFYLHCIIYYNN